MIRQKHTTFVRTKPPVVSKHHPKGLFQESMIEEVHKLARFGLTNQEIADFYGIGLSTFEGYQRKYPEFNDKLQEGRMLDSMKIVDSLHKQALGYEVTETEVAQHMTKWGEIINLTKVTRKHIQPSVTAAIYLLKTRHGDKWADVIKNENTNNINFNFNHNFDLSKLPTEDLKTLEKIGLKMQNKRALKETIQDATEA